MSTGNPHLFRISDEYQSFGLRPPRVPANRMGSSYYSTAQLKTMQEVIALLVFVGFSVFWLKESITINHVIGFALIAAGAAFIFRS
ncbi:DMT family protein [Rhizobium sp. KVB221]|uniref:DMT family protein n=1 Tax=Rhizobium setariae TaxID=2801340 RepID=A0A937CQJ3_9HYPH|nr:DMT family protein [Rhizobium setariae]